MKKQFILPNLDDLTLYGLEFQTDKAYWHQYTPIYYKYFSQIRFNQNIILIFIFIL